MKLLVCEGDADSLDFRFYSKLLQLWKLTPMCAAKPLGGKHGLVRAAEIYAQWSAVSPTDVFVVMDRDLDAQPEFDKNSLPKLRIETRENKRIVRLSRSTVESYYLTSEWISRFVAESNVGLDLGAYDAAVGTLVPYQATRWALARQIDEWCLREEHVRSSWVARDGDLPNECDEFQSCVGEAVKYRDQHVDRFAKIVDIEAEAKVFLKIFNGITNDTQRTTWFHGKDIQKILNRKGVAVIDDRYFTWCIEQTATGDFPELYPLRDLIGN